MGYSLFAIFSASLRGLFSMQEPPFLNFSDNVKQMLGFLSGHLLENILGQSSTRTMGIA